MISSWTGNPDFGGGEPRHGTEFADSDHDGLHAGIGAAGLGDDAGGALEHAALGGAERIAHAAGEGGVIDRVRQVVGGHRLREVEPKFDIHDEALLALALVRAVADDAEDFDAVEADGVHGGVPSGPSRGGPA